MSNWINAVLNCLFFRTEVFQKGLTAAKKQLESVYSQMQTFLDMNQVISAGPFLYATVLQVVKSRSDEQITFLFLRYSVDRM